MNVMDVMEQRATRSQRILAGAFLCIMGAMVWLIGYGISARAAEKLRDEIRIDWQKLYPFPPSQEEDVPTHTKPSFVTSLASKIDAKLRLSYIKEKIEKWTTEKLIGYMTFTETAKRYENIIGWNLASMSDYNGVVTLHDGYLISFVEKRDVSEAVNSTIELADFCKQKGIDFLYVNAPRKICKFEDADISGTLDFSNQNADEFLRQLSVAGVKYCDLREALHAEGVPHHESFYRTDNHWRLETALWASRHILQFLHDEFYHSIDSSALDMNRFTSVEYPVCFLGDYGKKMTLARTVPDDFTLLYPNDTMSFHLKIPTLGIDRYGDFSTLYDMSRMERIDYYTQSQYNDLTYNNIGAALISIDNQLNTQNVKLLIIRDSFGGGVIQYLSMGVKNVDAIDPRQFTGSVHNYIETTKPDIVIVLMHAGVIGVPIDWNTHTSFFDFR